MAIKLFCFPFAGASANIYKKWRNKLRDSITLCPVELKGRGSRFGEKLYSTFEEASDDLYQSVEKQIGAEPVAFFGYSMGSALALDTALRLQAQKSKRPVHLFLAARQAPHKDNYENGTHLLPDELFKKKILELGGTTKEFFDNEDLTRIFIPIIRADYALNASCRRHDYGQTLNCDFSLLGGDRDVFTEEDLREWSRYTTGRCDIHMFPGNHFFINEQEAAIIGLINETLAKPDHACYEGQGINRIPGRLKLLYPDQ